MIAKSFVFESRYSLSSGCQLVVSRGLAAALAHTPTDGVPQCVSSKYAREDVVPVHAKLRYSTLLVLPDNEEILDFTTGDKEFWIINGAHNLCYVHPAQAGIRSNLNLITASGHVYSFLLTEISSEPNAEPDLKLFVEPKESSGATSLQGYVRAGEAEAYKKELRNASRRKPRPAFAPPKLPSASDVNRFRSEYAAKAALRLHARRQGRARTVSRLRHLSRRRVHLHPVRRARKTRAVRSEGRQAQSDPVPVRKRRVHRPQDRRQRLSRRRQKEAHVHAPDLRASKGARHERTDPSGMRQSAEATRPPAEERAVLAHLRPRRAHGRDHVADRREKTAATPKPRRPTAGRAAHGRGERRPRSPNCRIASRSCSANNSSPRTLSRSRAAFSGTGSSDSERPAVPRSGRPNAPRTPSRRSARNAATFRCSPRTWR